MQDKNLWALKLWFTLLAILISLWLWNAFKFATCDFEANYKCEVIHGAGMFIPPLFLFTVWFPGD